MKVVLLIAVPGGAIFTLLVWSLSRLSSDAVALALGLTLGVLSLIPSLWLVTLARRRDAQDEYADDYQPIDAYPTTPDDYPVTPYYHMAQRLIGSPTPADNQAQITELRQYLAHLEAQESNERRFIVRWESEAN